MFNIDAAFIERLKDEGYDVWTISQWERWLQLLPKMVDSVTRLRSAFRDAELGDGVGLFEANGLDDYASDAELARLRQLDERSSWESIDAKSLNQYCRRPFILRSPRVCFSSSGISYCGTQ